MLDDDLRGNLLGLLYLVQFEKDPEQHVERVLAQVVFARFFRGERKPVPNAIDRALASSADLSTVVPGHRLSDAKARAFLRALRQRLVTGNRPKPSVFEGAMKKLQAFLGKRKTDRSDQ